MLWIFIGVGLVAAIALTILAFTRRARAAARPTSEQYIIMGTVFLAVGGGTIPTLGFVMLGMVAAGIVLLAVGARLRAAEQHDA